MRPIRQGSRSPRGLTLIDVVVVIAVMLIIGSVAAPRVLAGLDRFRTAAAARYVAARARLTRMEAVKRSTRVALVFGRAGSNYVFACYVDGNGNGVRRGDIARGRDTRICLPERLEDQFPGVGFQVGDGLEPIDGQGNITAGSDAVRLGRSDILTFSPDGTASSGTLYIRGRSGSQYAVRVLGATGRTRVLEFNAGARRWIEH